MKPMKKAEMAFWKLTQSKAQQGDKSAQNLIQMSDNINKIWNRPTIEEQMNQARESNK